MMKLNNSKHLGYFSRDKNGVAKEGWLLKKGEVNTSYQKRWCVLKGNLMFYYDKRYDSLPIGTIILEKCSVQLCEGGDSAYTFSIHFEGDATRVYKFTAENERLCHEWVKALTTCSFKYMQMLVREMTNEVNRLREMSKCSESNHPGLNKELNANLLDALPERPQAESALKSRNLWLTGSSTSLAELGVAKAGTAVKSSASMIKKLSPKPMRRRMQQRNSPTVSNLGIFSNAWTFKELHEEYRKQLFAIADNTNEVLFASVNEYSHEMSAIDLVESVNLNSPPGKT